MAKLYDIAEAAGAIDFREVVENLTDGVLLTDGSGVVIYVNPAYSRHAHIPPEEILGRSVIEVADEGILFRHSNSADVLRSGRHVSNGGFMRTIDGTDVYGYSSGVPLFDEQRNIRMVVSSFMDVDELRTRFEKFKDTLREEDAIQIYERYAEQDGETLIGENPVLSKILRIIVMAAPTDVTILITGESGVGKEVLADRIQRLSLRKNAPYVKVNCTAIPANLLESELFGYEKGAFTGASSSGKKGLFEVADTGTILLDEIGDLPIELQTKLLRVLQDKEIMRIGGTKPRPLDVRVIAATNSNLKQKIAEGKFREDLYYRLSVIPVEIPPLRERREDILPIAKYYFNEYCKRYGRSLILPESSYARLEAYDWPGNIRELQNIIEYLVICAENGVFDEAKLAEIIGMPFEAPAPPSGGLREAVEELERKLIAEAVERTGGVRRAAAELRVDPSTVSRKAKKYGIPVAE